MGCRSLALLRAVRHLNDVGAVKHGMKDVIGDQESRERHAIARGDKDNIPRRNRHLEARQIVLDTQPRCTGRLPTASSAMKPRTTPMIGA